MENINYILGGVSDEQVEQFVKAFNAAGVPKQDTALMIKVKPDAQSSFVSRLGNFHLEKSDLEKTFGTFGVVKEVRVLTPG